MTKVKDILGEFINNIDFKAISTSLGNLWAAFQPFAEGFADTLIDAFDILINDIGAPMITALGTAIGWLSSKLASLDPELLKSLGVGAAVFGIGLKTISITSTLLENIGKLSTKLGDLKKVMSEGTDSATLGKTAEMVDDLGEAATNAGGKVGVFGSVLATLKNIIGGNGPVSGTVGLGVVLGHTMEVMEQSTTIANNSASAIAGALAALQAQGVITNDQFLALIPTFDSVGTSSFNILEHFDTVCTALENAGVSSDLFKQEFEKALKEASSSSDTYTDTINKYLAGTGTSLKELGSAAGTTAEGIETEMTTAFANTEKDTSSSWGMIDSYVLGALSSMDDETKTAMNNVMTTVQSKWSSVLRNTNSIWGKASLKVAKELINMKDSTDTATNLIASKFSTLGTKIQSSIGNLYSVGQQAASSFRDGFTSIHIPTPHLYTSSWTRHYTNAEKTNWYSTPNYAVSWYKHGGLFNGASVIGVGEAGREAVLPLENKSTMRMIAESILSNAPTNAWDAMDMMNAVAAGVSMAMSSGSFNNNYDRPMSKGKIILKLT